MNVWPSAASSAESPYWSGLIGSSEEDLMIRPSSSLPITLVSAPTFKPESWRLMRRRLSEVTLVMKLCVLVCVFPDIDSPLCPPALGLLSGSTFFSLNNFSFLRLFRNQRWLLRAQPDLTACCTDTEWEAINIIVMDVCTWNHQRIMLWKKLNLQDWGLMNPDSPLPGPHAVMTGFSSCVSPLAAARIFLTTNLQAEKKTENCQRDKLAAPSRNDFPAGNILTYINNYNKITRGWICFRLRLKK